MRDRIEHNNDIILSYICNLKAQGMDKTGEIMG